MEARNIGFNIFPKSFSAASILKIYGYCFKALEKSRSFKSGVDAKIDVSDLLALSNSAEQSGGVGLIHDLSSCVDELMAGLLSRKFFPDTIIGYDDPKTGTEENLWMLSLTAPGSRTAQAIRSMLETNPGRPLDNYLLHQYLEYVDPTAIPEIVEARMALSQKVAGSDTQKKHRVEHINALTSESSSPFKPEETDAPRALLDHWANASDMYAVDDMVRALYKEKNNLLRESRTKNLLRAFKYLLKRWEDHPLNAKTDFRKGLFVEALQNVTLEDLSFNGLLSIFFTGDADQFDFYATDAFSASGSELLQPQSFQSGKADGCKGVISRPIYRWGDFLSGRFAASANFNIEKDTGHRFYLWSSGMSVVEGPMDEIPQTDPDLSLRVSSKEITLAHVEKILGAFREGRALPDGKIPDIRNESPLEALYTNFKVAGFLSKIDADCEDVPRDYFGGDEDTWFNRNKLYLNLDSAQALMIKVRDLRKSESETRCGYPLPVFKNAVLQQFLTVPANPVEDEAQKVLVAKTFKDLYIAFNPEPSQEQWGLDMVPLLLSEDYREAGLMSMLSMDPLFMGELFSSNLDPIGQAIDHNDLLESKALNPQSFLALLGARQKDHLIEVVDDEQNNNLQRDYLGENWPSFQLMQIVKERIQSPGDALPVITRVIQGMLRHGTKSRNKFLDHGSFVELIEKEVLPKDSPLQGSVFNLLPSLPKTDEKTDLLALSLGSPERPDPATTDGYRRNRFKGKNI